MADNDSTELERGPASIRAFVLRALELLARDLLEKADRNGGLLNTSEIDAAAEEFKRSHAAAIGGISAAAWEECGVIFDSEQRGEDRKDRDAVREDATLLMGEVERHLMFLCYTPRCSSFVTTQRFVGT